MMIDLRSMEIPSDEELLQKLSLEEQRAQDRDCDLAKREHKWYWIWEDGKMTDQGKCSKCGQTRNLCK